MGGLGDSLLVYPVIEILKKKGYKVTVWGNPEYFRLAQIAGYCDTAIFYQPGENFDLKIFFTKNKEFFEQDKNSVFVDPVVQEKIWIVKHYLKSLKFENEIFSQTLTLGFSEQKCANLCIIHPGSGSKRKNPEINFFYEAEKIIKSYGFNTLYLIGPAEKEFSKFFKNSVYFQDPVEIAKTILKASLYIGSDSGVSHLSSYLGVPSIVIFGPTDPSVWHPVGEKLWILRNNSCPPCFPDVCPERRCLQKDYLITELRQILKNLCYRHYLNDSFNYP